MFIKSLKYERTTITKTCSPCKNERKPFKVFVTENVIQNIIHVKF